ncbi:MAG: peptidase [Rhizonema sp. NSF051]|nr:peptidase [Rhizonema sp. NSF051]
MTTTVLRKLLTLGLAVATGVIVIWTNLQSNITIASYSNLLTKQSQYASDLITSLPSSPTSSLPSSVPPPQAHPLPPTLAQWQDSKNSGDYFSQVSPTKVGYLVWSQFPVKVYIEPLNTLTGKQAEAWVNNVLEAVKEWNAYLPLIITEKPEIADITIVRKAPPLQTNPSSKIPRARSAQTTYNYISKNNLLSHSFTILLSPSQTGQYLTAATRHELGHALGIWGHSPLQTDALYFSQVRNPSPISSRDVNTLKRVYEQPTSLGW